MIPTDDTIKQLIVGQFGDALSDEEIAAVASIVRRQYQISERLAELDLGGLDPRSTQYITDRRLTP